jgi:3-oxoadipate enol-lactonase
MMKTAVGARAPFMARLIYHLPLGLVRAVLKSRLTPAAYGSAAPPEAAAKDMEVLASDRFTMTGVRAQSEAIAAYAATREAFEHIAAPTLVLHGDEDTAVDVKHGRELAEVIPNSRLVIFQGAGHNYLVAAGPASTAAVLNFFDEVDGV